MNTKVLYRELKRSLDLVFALLGLLVLSPIMLLIWLLLRGSLGVDPVFRQQRAGLRGKTFLLLKFKTMKDTRDDAGVLLPDKDRLTRVGKFIRSTSLDELPQFINVIRGDMSLVGPRPLLVKYLPLYTERQSRRHEVRPGITGWAQVNGRNAISWEQRFELDVHYVDHIGFGLDLMILWKTFVKVIRREGISGADSPTMSAFTGTPTSSTKA